MEQKKQNCENTVEKWRRVILLCFEKGGITEESKDLLLSLLTQPEIICCLNHETMPAISEEQMKETVQKNLSVLREVYETRDLLAGKLHQEDVYGSIRKRWGVNTDKYIEGMYEAIKPHMILHAVFGQSGQAVINLLEKQVCYRKYGKYLTLDGDYYCQSPIKDLIISNVSRGTLYKRVPKDMNNKAEYDYDKDGRLILYKWHVEEDRIYFTEGLLYGESQILHIRYGEANKGCSIQMISIQSYDKDLIAAYEETNFVGIGTVSFERESYEYADGILCTARREGECTKFQGAGMWRLYIFERDEEGCLKGYQSKVFCGDGEIDELLYYYEANNMEVDQEEYETWKNWIEPIPDKKRRDTGKDAGRWRRPNCRNL